jgi:hypothetical protein
MDVYDRRTNVGKKNRADCIVIYGRGRELFRPHTYVTINILSTVFGTSSVFGIKLGINVRNTNERVTFVLPNFLSLIISK